MRIAQLETSGAAGDAASYEAVRELSAAVHTRDLRRLDEISLNIEANVFEVKEDIAELKRRLANLEKKNIGARTITAHVSGTFSHVVDGFEHITPELVYEITPTELHANFKTPYSIHGAGKLITEFTWYYVAVMNHEDAAQLSAGQIKAIQFFGAFQSEINMLVESVGMPEGSSCVVLFSSDRGIHDVAPLRSLHADVVYEVITGIRVPIEAVHRDDDGTAYVYLQTSGYAEKVDVEILRETGDSYLVRDGAETGTPLRVDSIIIVRGNNLYHGKVVG